MYIYLVFATFALQMISKGLVLFKINSSPTAF